MAGIFWRVWHHVPWCEFGWCSGFGLFGLSLYWIGRFLFGTER